MKILQIDAYNYRRGGAETVYLNTSALLEEKGHEVVNFALQWKENMPSRFSSFFPKSKQVRKGVFKPFNNIVTYFYHREAGRNLARLIESERPDIAQIHLIWGQLTPSILEVLRKYNVPAILTAHDYRLVCPAYVFRNGDGQVCEKCQGHKFYKCITNACCRGSHALSVMMAAEQYFRNRFFNPAELASGIIYVSDFSRNLHEKYMPSLKSLPTARIYNFTDEIELKDVQQEDYLLYFGRLSAEKGVKTLIDAMAQRPRLNLKIAGTGPMAVELQERVRSCGIRNVEFLGFKSGEELRRLVAEARYVVVPSECYENNPMTIVEAYSVGTPVIGAGIGGIPEIIEEGVTGFTFASRNVASLSKAFDKAFGVTDSDYLQMKYHAREFADANFGKENYYRQLMKFYTKVLQSKGDLRDKI